MTISTENTNFKSAEFIYSKIKREFKSFGYANLIDDADFPLYTAEVLKTLGAGVYKESDAFLRVVNGKACLPEDFIILHSAYYCGSPEVVFNTRNQFQRPFVVENDITCDILARDKNCKIDCEKQEKIIERVTIRKYINETNVDYKYEHPSLLTLSKNSASHCQQDCPNLQTQSANEISISGKYILANFSNANIYMLYYAFPKDDEGLPMIPDDIRVEKAIEWYIKWQILLNYWMVDDVANIQNKWGKAEQMYKEAFSEAKWENKLPSFNTLLESARLKRNINPVSYFASQIDRNRR